MSSNKFAYNIIMATDVLHMTSTNAMTTIANEEIITKLHADILK